MPGTLAVQYMSGTSLLLTFTAGATFDSGTLYYSRSDTGVTATQAVVSGDNTITGLAGGIRVIAWVVSVDAASALLGSTNAVTLTTIRGTVVGQDKIILEWRTDKTDWQEAEIATDLERATYPVDVRGFYFQQNIHCRTQNKRLTFSGLKLHERIQGRGSEANS